jgi:hypothetical protein
MRRSNKLLAEANEEQIKEAFTCIQTGDTAKLFQLLDLNPGLLLQAVLYQIRFSLDWRIKNQLCDFLKNLIGNYQEKLDLSYQDEKGDTALHHVFLYALSAPDDELSKKLLEIGCLFIGLLKNTSEFRNIIATKNIFKNTFLTTIFLHSLELSSQEQRNLLYIEQQLAPLINPYKQINEEETPASMDFSRKSFIARLKEMLIDPFTYNLMRSPFIFAKDGYTFDELTWERFKPKLNPFTGHEFKPEELVLNQTVIAIINLYNQYKMDEKKLATEMQNYFDGGQAHGDLTDGEVTDLLTRDIKNLLAAYQTSLALAQSNQPELGRDNPPTVVNEPETVSQEGAGVTESTKSKNQIIQELIVELAMNISEKKNDRVKWFTQNSKAKVEKLMAIHKWLDSHKLTDGGNSYEGMVLSIIQNVCAVKRNKLGFFAPHSLHEFKEKVSKLKLCCCNDFLNLSENSLDKLNSQDDGVTYIFEQMGLAVANLRFAKPIVSRS